MRERLTVSEVAKLLDVSAYTVRYYDKEGLITSEHDSENGYRLFDFNDVYRLANVMMLRDSGLSIKAIKELIGHFSREAYKKQLEESLCTIDEQIEKLNRQRAVVKGNLDALNYEKNQFIIKNCPDRPLTVIGAERYDDRKSLKAYALDMNDKNLSKVLYKHMIYELKEEEMLLYYESSTGDLVLQAGEYLMYHVTIKDDSEVDKAVSEFYNYCSDHDIDVEHQLYMDLPPSGMLVVDDGYEAILFAKIS